MYKANISTCDLLRPTKIIFELVSPGLNTTQLCSLNFTTCDPNWTAQGCKCTGDSLDAYTFAFNFTFQRSFHERHSLMLTTDCSFTGYKNGLFAKPCNLEEGNTRHVSVAVTLYPCLCLFSLSTENKSSKVTFRSVFTASRVLCLFVRSYVAVSKAKLAGNLHIVLCNPY